VPPEINATAVVGRGHDLLDQRMARPAVGRATTFMRQNMWNGGLASSGNSAL